MELSGKVVVVPVDWVGAGGLATRLGGAGATVVLVGDDGEAAGRLAATVEAAATGRGRPAVFLTDGTEASLDALAAFVSELFRAP
jgi:NAD(P)-dependent dehydrogenase (short-subunit alcohol dehydrogenase family)